MFSGTDLPAVLADVAILLALLAAGSPRPLSLTTRLLIAALALPCAWVVAAAADAARAPTWTIFMGGTVILLNIVVLVAALHRWALPPDALPRGPSHRDDEGGGGPGFGGPDAPRAGGGGGASWWPEFERQLWLYVAERERQSRSHEAPAPTTPGGCGKEFRAPVVHIGKHVDRHHGDNPERIRQ